MTGPAVVLGPREVFACMQQHWLDNDPGLDADLLADDAVIELPFAAPGRRSRFAGREEFLAFARPARSTFPVRFTACRTVAVHDTTDPEVIVVEYELTGTHTTTGHQATAGFIGILRVRDGKTVHWREYQNTAAIAAALTPPK
jgi:ketosteroid isomerase-like protein